MKCFVPASPKRTERSKKRSMREYHQIFIRKSSEAVLCLVGGNKHGLFEKHSCSNLPTEYISRWSINFLFHISIFNPTDARMDAGPPQIGVGPGFDSQGSINFFTKYCFPNLHWIHDKALEVQDWSPGLLTIQKSFNLQVLMILHQSTSTCLSSLLFWMFFMFLLKSILHFCCCWPNSFITFLSLKSTMMLMQFCQNSLYFFYTKTSKELTFLHELRFSNREFFWWATVLLVML